MNTKDMDIITLDDLNCIINNYDNKIYNNTKNNLSNEEIIKEIYNELLQKYKLNDKDDDLSVSRKLYFHNYVKYSIHKKVVDFENRIKDEKYSRKDGEIKIFKITCNSVQKLSV